MEPDAWLRVVFDSDSERELTFPVRTDPRELDEAGDLIETVDHLDMEEPRPLFSSETIQEKFTEIEKEVNEEYEDPEARIYAFKLKVIEKFTNKDPEEEVEE